MSSSKSSNLFRIAVALIGFWSAIFLPPWVPAIAIVVLAIRFRAWEAIFLGFVIDCLWLPSGVPWCTLGAIAVVWLLEPLRSAFLS